MGLGIYQLSNIEEELKAQTRFIFNTHLKGTYKSQKLGKGKGFGSAGSLLTRGARVWESELSLRARAEARGDRWIKGSYLHNFDHTLQVRGAEPKSSCCCAYCMVLVKMCAEIRDAY